MTLFQNLVRASVVGVRLRAGDWRCGLGSRFQASGLGIYLCCFSMRKLQTARVEILLFFEASAGSRDIFGEPRRQHVVI